MACAGAGAAGPLGRSARCLAAGAAPRPSSFGTGGWGHRQPIRLPKLANENTACPLRFERQMNNKNVASKNVPVSDGTYTDQKLVTVYVTFEFNWHPCTPSIGWIVRAIPVIAFYFPVLFSFFKSKRPQPRLPIMPTSSLKNGNCPWPAHLPTQKGPCLTEVAQSQGSPKLPASSAPVWVWGPQGHSRAMVSWLSCGAKMCRCALCW